MHYLKSSFRSLLGIEMIPSLPAVEGDCNYFALYHSHAKRVTLLLDAFYIYRSANIINIPSVQTVLIVRATEQVGRTGLTD